LYMIISAMNKINLIVIRVLLKEVSDFINDTAATAQGDYK